MVLKVSAEEGGLGAGVRERDPHVTDHRCLVLLHAQLGGALLEHHLQHSGTLGQRGGHALPSSSHETGVEDTGFKEGGSGGRGSRFDRTGLDRPIAGVPHGQDFFTPSQTWPHNHQKMDSRTLAG